jgi:hypothetical protein
VVNEFIYNNPTWLWATLVVTFFVGLSCLGLAAFHRMIGVELRKAHNDLAGFTVAIISVTYAVLLAFIAIATWESYIRAEDIVQSEADFVGSIYRDTQGLPAEMGRDIRADLQDYIGIVIHQEWPIQRAGETPSEGWRPLHKLHSAIATMRPADLGESVIEAELLKTLNELYRARASRLSAAAGHIPDVVWWIILFGGAITTGYTYLFGFHSFGMHLVMTASVAASLALVVVLIMALDWPFRGEVSISPDAFIQTQQSWNELQFDKK